MVLIQNSDEQSAEHRQDGGSAPEGPMLDRHADKRLPPAVEKSDADQSVAYEMAGLADEMMHLVPVRRADGAKEPNPVWEKPFAGVFCRHGGSGLKSDHENAERGRYPIQNWLQPGQFE